MPIKINYNSKWNSCYCFDLNKYNVYIFITEAIWHFSSTIFVLKVNRTMSVRNINENYVFASQMK